MNIRSKMISTMIRVYPRWGLRASDVILASYPKSGNTWLRFIWANVISLLELDGRHVDYHLLNGDLVAEYDIHRYGSLEYTSAPRWVKTHYTYSQSRFGENKSVYICRNPGDVMVSYYHYLRGLKKKPRSFSDKMSFDVFIRSQQFGLPAWVQHVGSWLEHATAHIIYEDLKADTMSCLRETLDHLNIAYIPDFVLTEAIRRSDISAIQRVERKKGFRSSNQKEVFKTEFKFARDGSVGQWKEYFTEEDELFMKQILEDNDLIHVYNYRG